MLAAIVRAWDISSPSAAMSRRQAAIALGSNLVRLAAGPIGARAALLVLENVYGV